MPSKSVILLVSALMVSVLGCRKGAELTVENRLSRTYVQDVFWGDLYIGGNLHPGESTGFQEIRRSQASLPAAERLYINVDDGDTTMQYYTLEYLELSPGEQRVFVLTDSTMIFLRESL